MKKKFLGYSKLFVAGAIGSAMLAATVMTVFAGKSFVSAGQKADPLNPTAVVTEKPLPEDANDTIEDFVKKQTDLTDAERQLLIEEEKASMPIYEALDRLDEQIEMKTREVLKGADPAFDERAKLFDQHADLWAKIENSSNEEQKNAKTYADYIRASQTLTEAEKEILLKAQKRIDELDAVIESYYAKAEEETADLRRQQEDELEKLHDLQEKTRSVWDKIYTK